MIALIFRPAQAAAAVALACAGLGGGVAVAQYLPAGTPVARSPMTVGLPGGAYPVGPQPTIVTGPTMPAAATPDLQTALEELDVWLAGSDYGPTWREYLDLNTLTEEVAETGTVSRATAAAAAERFSRNVPGLNLPLFAQVRAALIARANSPVSDLERLADRAEAAIGAIRPITPAEVAQRKAALVEAVVAVEAALARGPVEYALAWKDFLLWNDFSPTVTSDSPDLRVLVRTDRRLSTGREGLEWPPFVRLRARLKEFGAVYYFYADGVEGADERVREGITARLERLADRLRRAAANPSDVNLAEVGRLIGDLELLGQIPDLVAEVRSRFNQPNIFARVSERLVRRFVDQPVQDVRPVREVILGTDIRGIARTNATVTADLKPAQGAVGLLLRFQGVICTDNTGVNRGVEIETIGTTRVAGEKYVQASLSGVTAGPASVRADTSTVVTDIIAKLRIIERIAAKQVARQKSEAEQIASQRAADRIRDQFEQRAGPQLAQANAQVRTLLPRLDVLNRRDLYPQSIGLGSTETTVDAFALTRDRYQLAAPTAPPTPQTFGDVTLTVHESAIGNVAEAFLSGVTIATGQMAGMAADDAIAGSGITITPSDAAAKRVVRDAERVAEEAAELLSGEDATIETEEEVEATFATTRPVAVEFRGDGTIRAILRFDRLVRGETTIRRLTEVSVRFRVLRGGGTISLVRAGPVAVDFPGRSRLSASEVALRGILQERLEEVVPARVDGISVATIEAIVRDAVAEGGGSPLGNLATLSQGRISGLTLAGVDLSQGWASLSLIAY